MTRRSFFKRGIAALVACVGWKLFGGTEQAPTAPCDFWDAPASGYSTNTWHHGCATFTSSASRACYIDRAPLTEGDIKWAKGVLREVTA